MDLSFKDGLLNYKYKEKHHNINATTLHYKYVYYILSTELIGWL